MATPVQFECDQCDYKEEILIDLDKYVDWKYKGIYIQDTFPDLTAGQRELIKTQICGTCWDKMFNFPDDEEE